ncbi:MAG: hypothetical protein BWY61_02161 [Firmicutes bacterium ADurb.Bin354]|nr:hypothetical protein [Lachnospiraceae bacterium]OQA17068.1 MAG: hypothetical protein BWY61_02161 [Firmicutes bacterium ADurb.Bin354]
MLIKLERITTPVVLVIDDTETEYRSGSDAVATLGLHNRLEAVEIAVRDNKIVIRLEPWRLDDPDNYIGEAAISY